MMIKKKISFQAASVVVASGAQAATQGGSGTDSDVILALADFGGAGGTYLVNLTAETGVSTDNLQAGNGVTWNLSGGASAFASGASDLRWALFTVSGEDGPYVTYTTSTGGGYNYFYDNLDPNYGVVYAVTGTPPLAGITGANLDSQIGSLNAWIGDATAAGIDAAGGVGVGAGTAADYNKPARTTAMNGALFNGAGDLAQLFYLKTDPAGRTGNDPILNGPISITTPGGSQQGAYMNGTSSFNITSVATVIPVPAAAWLFGSALLGLGVVRRK